MSIQTASGPVYEEFQPPSDWDHDKESATLILMLPGFRKEQLRVQVSSNRMLRVSGERKISDNKWRRFRNEFSIPESNDTSGISAKFEAGMLYVKIPKLITPQPPKPTTGPKPEPEPADVDKPAESKPEPQTPPLQDPKTEEKDSQEKTEKKEKEAETDGNGNGNGNDNKTYDEVQEANGSTAQTASQEPKEDSEKESEKEKEKIETERKEEIAETVTSQAPKMHGISSDDEFGMKSVIANVKKRYSSTLNMMCDLVKEAKKQNKLVNLVVAIFLVLLVGLYIKNIIVKSSFGGTGSKSQEF